MKIIRTSSLLILMPFACFLLVACTGQPETGQGQKIAEDFLAGIKQGKSPELWEATSSEFKSLMGKDQFLVFVKSSPMLKEVLTFKKEEKSLEGNTWYLYSFASPKSDKLVKVFIGKDKQEWLVQGMKIE